MRQLASTTMGARLYALYLVRAALATERMRGALPSVPRSSSRAHVWSRIAADLAPYPKPALPRPIPHTSMQERAQRSPMFVVPMRADEDSPADGDSAADPDASEAPVAPPAAAPPLNIFVQQQGAHVLFSDLEEYKLLGTEATPLATLTHYADLAEDKVRQ